MPGRAFAAENSQERRDDHRHPMAGYVRDHFKTVDERITNGKTAINANGDEKVQLADEKH